MKTKLLTTVLVMGYFGNVFANTSIGSFSDLVMQGCRLNSLNRSLDAAYTVQELLGSEVMETWGGGGKGSSLGFDVKRILNGGKLKLKLLNGFSSSVFPYEPLKSVQKFPFYERFESGGPADTEFWVSLEIFELQGIQLPPPASSIKASYEIVLRMVHMDFVGEKGTPAVLTVRVLSFTCPKK